MTEIIMAEDVVQSTPIEPIPTMVVPPMEEPKKKGSGLLWLAIVFGVFILGGAGYFLYIQQTKPSEEVLQTPPVLVTQEGKPNQGFGLSTPTPSATPTITSSDTVADIEKDLSGTNIEAGNSSEFTTDLQSL